MSVDPTDPDVFEDEYETYEDEPEEQDRLEAPEADAAEQQAELMAQRDMPITRRGTDEVDPADAAEQARVVELNEDDYR